MIWLVALQLVLAWEYEGPAPDKFLLALIDHTGHEQNVTVAPSAPGACKAIPGAGPTTYCAVWPNCLTPGVWVFLAATEIGNQQSAPSNPLTCQVAAENPCLCTTSTALLTKSGVSLPTQQAAQPHVSALPQISPDVQAILNEVPKTAPGTPLAGPELLRDALNVSAPAIQMPGGT